MSDPPRPDLGGTPPAGAGRPSIPPPPPGGRGVWVGVAGIVVAVALIAGGVVWVMRADGERSSSSESVTPAALLARAPADAQAAGCGGVIDVGPYLPADEDAAHVDPQQMPPLSSWPSVPPTSGPHVGETLPAGQYVAPPPILTVIHSLEHGAVVVWHAPDAPAGELGRIAEFYRNPALGDHVIVAPYDYPEEGEAGRLSDGVTMALVAWHHQQLCAEVSLGAAFGFSADYAFPTFQGRPYLGDAREPGVGI